MERQDETVGEDLVGMNKNRSLGAREAEVEVMGITRPTHRKEIRVHFDEGAAVLGVEGVAAAIIDGVEGGFAVYQPAIREAFIGELL